MLWNGPLADYVWWLAWTESRAEDACSLLLSSHTWPGLVLHFLHKVTCRHEVTARMAGLGLMTLDVRERSASAPLQVCHHPQTYRTVA